MSRGRKGTIMQGMSRTKCYLKYTGLFLIIFFLGFLAFFIQGKSLIWEGDGYRQYYPVLHYLGQYYREIIRNVLHGNFEIPMIDYSIGQGEDIITTFSNYGLGDPLTLFSVFVPGKYTEYLYDFLVVLRLYLSGISFLIYCGGMKLSRRFSIYGALTYVFCGFAVWSVKDPFFLNAMIYLPVVLLGIENILKKKNPLLLAAGVFLSIVSGYYFFYMIVICAVCYFVVRYIMCHGVDIKEMGKAGLRCLVVSLGGVLMSGVLFVPCLYGYLESSRTENYTSLSSLLFYDFDYYKNMISRFIMVTENDDAGAVGYFSMAVIILVAVYVLARKKEKKYKMLKWCVLLCFIAVASPLAGYIFNGFGYVTNRFMFIPAFILSLVLVLVLPDIISLQNKEKKTLIIVAACYVAVSLLCSSKEGISAFVVMTLLLGGTIACVHFVRDNKWRERAVCGLIVINLIGNCSLLYQGVGVNMADVYMKAGTGYKAYTSDRTVNAARKRCGDGLERVDVMLHRGENPNQSVVADYNGISVYFSVIGSGYSEYMKSVENTADLMFSHRVLGNDGRSILENLANVRYVVSKKKELVPYGFKQVDGKRNLYENQNQTSIGYTYDSYISEEAYDEAEVLERQSVLTQAAVLEKDSELYSRAMESESVREMAVTSETIPSPESLLFDMTEVENFEWVGGNLRVKEKNGTFKIGFTMRPGYEYYFRLAGLELTEADRKFLWAHVKMDKLTKSFLISDRSYDFYFGRSNYMVNLGSLGNSENLENPENLGSLDSEASESEEKQLFFRINGPAEYSLDNIQILEVPVSGVSEAIENLNRESLQEANVSGNCLAGKLSVSGDKILCLAVPYQKGYTLYVDGERTPVSRLNKMYTGAWIQKGEHEILLEYSTPGLLPGVVLSIIGALMSAVFAMIHFRLRKTSGK